MQVRRGLAVIGAGVVLVAAAPTFAGATGAIKDVLVTNKGEEQAIPTKATGVTPVSGTVTVGNLPATQEVSGDVTVTNLPGVQTVRDAEAPHRRPFTQGTEGASTIAIPDGALGADDTFEIALEPGKRLVAQHVSGAITLPPGQVPQLTTLEVGGTIESSRRVDVLAQQISASPRNVWKFSHPVTFYAEPGDTVRFRVNRFPDDIGLGFFRWTVVGHLVDA